jgi:hypothetical protein
MAWSAPDLLHITDVLHAMLQDSVNAAGLTNVRVSCSGPEIARKPGNHCQLTLYLLHVGRDPYWRNTPVEGRRAQLNTAQPLSLNLSYLLTAWFDADFATEQKAMSAALQAIHAQPIHKTSGEEFTISIEADTIEEMSRLWQAITVPMRLSALIRVAVVFLAPAARPAASALPPTTSNLAVAPYPALEAQGPPMLYFGDGLRLDAALSAEPSGEIDAQWGPLTAVGGGTVAIAGSGLDQPQAAKVFLRTPDGATEWLVHSWRTGPVTQGEMRLKFPSSYADPRTGIPAPDAALPSPGLYLLSVSSWVPAGRSNMIPLAVAPQLTGVANPPLLTPDGSGVYTVVGKGFAPSATTLALGSANLSEAVNGLSPGRFTVSADGMTIAFQVPSPPPATGNYPLRIAVNGVRAVPVWVVAL